MGQGGSSEFKEAFQTTVEQLSELQLAEIGSRYNELYKQAGGNRGRIVDREKFSEYFELPVALGDRLFNAFDKKQNGSVDFEEFACGLAILTHGSFSDKCRLLFSVFNLAGDEGVSREELYSLIFSVVNSTNTILLTLTEEGKGSTGSPVLDLEGAVKNLVDTAFRNCDISRSGKLLPLEFEYWLKRNPKILDYLLPSLEDPEEQDTPTLVPLLFVPDRENEVIDGSETIPEDLASIQLGSDDVVIDMEGGVNEDGVNGGGVNEGGVNEGGVNVGGTNEAGVNVGVVDEGGVDENKVLEGGVVSCSIGADEGHIIDPMLKRSSEDDPAGTTEPPPSPTMEAENNEEEEVKMADNVVPKDLPLTLEDDTKQRTTSNLSANEETIKLARVLSESLTSPVTDDAPSLVLSDDGESKRVSNRILSSWLPSPHVEAMLSSGRRASPEYLTQPGLISQTGKYDHIAEVLSSAFPGVPRRQQVSVDQVKLDEEGLHILIQNGCYHGALELTSQFLTAHGQGLGQAGQMAMHTHKTLQMWYVRFTLLYCLGRYEEVERELRAFKDLDQPDLYYQYDKRQYPDVVGSMVPFPMRLLHAQLPLYLNNYHLALNRACFLQNNTQRILQLIEQGRLPLNEEELTPDEIGVAKEVWLGRLLQVKFAIFRCLLAIGDHYLARMVLEDVLELAPKHRNEVLSALGRLCLLYGDITSAESFFADIGAEQDDSMNKTNRCFIDLYQNRWDKAEQGFISAHSSDPSLTLNNATVCAVHQQRLSESISHLESSIKNTPPNNLNSSLFLSLFSCYDLESSQAQAKKLSWLPYLGQHAPEGFNMTELGLVT